MALDTVGGGVAVNVTGSVDTSVAGDYTLTYNAQDAAHNAAAPVTRTVTVYLAAVAVDDAVTATVGTTRVYPLANDYDPLGAKLSLVSTTGSGVTISPDGRALVIPAGYVGTFSYTETNGRGPSSANVSVVAGTPVTARHQWSGLFYDADGALAGWMQATRNASNGRFTYAVLVGGNRLSGIFSLDAVGTAAVGAMTVAEDAAHRLSITFTNGSDPLTGSLRQSVPSATARQINIALAGADRAAVPGGGLLRAFVKSTGAVNLLGTLPDGKGYTLRSTLVDNGSFTFYGPVSHSLGAFVAGEIVLANLAATDATGEFAWIKPTQPVPDTVTANGCIYSAGVALPNGAGTLSIGGGNFANDLTVATSIVGGRPIPTLLIPTWIAKPLLGTFIAKVKDPARARSVSGKGLYLPKSHSAWGYFPGVTVGGRISLTQP